MSQDRLCAPIGSNPQRTRKKNCCILRRERCMACVARRVGADYPENVYFIRNVRWMDLCKGEVRCGLTTATEAPPSPPYYHWRNPKSKVKVKVPHAPKYYWPYQRACTLPTQSAPGHLKPQNLKLARGDDATEVSGCRTHTNPGLQAQFFQA